MIESGLAVMKEREIEGGTEDLLDQFALCDEFDERLAALTGLIKARALHAYRDDERLAVAMEYIADRSTDRYADDERLRAIAALARIATVKSLSRRCEELLQPILAKPVPNIGVVSDPDDRYYVACALRHGNENWVTSYAARAIVEEKQAERARQELVSVLFARLGSIADVFSALLPALKEFRPETKNPADSVAKRIERIFSAIRPLLVSELLEPGERTGEQLQALLASSFSGSGYPETHEVAERTLEEVAGLVHDLARTQLSLVSDPTLYAVLELPSRWFPTPVWRYVASKSKTMSLVQRDLRDAMTLLAKQAVTDQSLFEQLVVAAGSREGAAAITRQIAERHPELDEDTRSWLANGGRTVRKLNTGTSGLSASLELSADPYLATLMLNSAHLRAALHGFSEDARIELRLLEPALAEPLHALIARCDSILGDIDALAAKRDLHAKGQKGDLVDYSPAVHELVGGHIQGVRKVRILEPMILRSGNVGQETVVRKALVERA